APLVLSQVVLPNMRKKKWGRIVNISSIWGKISKAYRAPYSASKFAIDGLTVAISAEVASDNVLVNSVAPGFIDTELTRGILGIDGMKKLANQVPIQRVGTTEEVAKFVAWLAGPDNTYISGQNIAIDGGFTRV
ncbi:MAG TPA: SDR family oxidoreductase, partial [Candidatus Thioglobus sp.]|nr:SDR family oxidoreductase [Candidatus Thioglobus sp.]